MKFLNEVSYRLELWEEYGAYEIVKAEKKSNEKDLWKLEFKALKEEREISLKFFCEYIFSKKEFDVLFLQKDETLKKVEALILWRAESGN